MEAFLAFLGENKAIVALLTGVVALLTAMLASGGAGTVVLKRILGERSQPQTPPPASINVQTDNNSVGVVNTGRGNVDIQQSRAPLRDPVESGRALNLPHQTTQEAVRRLQQHGLDDDALHESLADFAHAWHRARERVDRLAAADALDADTAAALETALRTADLAAVDRLCRPPEGGRRDGAAADRAAG